MVSSRKFVAWIHIDIDGKGKKWQLGLVKEIVPLGERQGDFHIRFPEIHGNDFEDVFEKMPEHIEIDEPGSIEDMQRVKCDELLEQAAQRQRDLENELLLLQQCGWSLCKEVPRLCSERTVPPPETARMVSVDRSKLKMLRNLCDPKYHEKRD